jgi:aminopeptidase N
MSNVPEGYLKDAKGHLVPLELVKPIDIARNDLVLELVGKAKAVSSVLAAFKADAFGDIKAFVDMSAEQYKAKIGGKKGNVTLMSFDGQFKVVQAAQDNIRFDERLQAARALIDECLTEWTQDARTEVRALVNQAFRADKQGEISTGRVLALRSMDIKDGRWQSAMEAIGDAVQVVGSKSYIRVYQRVGESDQYVPIPLDIASAALGATASTVH